MPRRDEQPQSVKTKPFSTPRAASKVADSESVDETKATISYNIQFTKSLGNYEFIRIGAELTLPVDASDEVIKKAEDQLVVIRDKVIARLSNDIADVTAALT